MMTRAHGSRDRSGVAVPGGVTPAAIAAARPLVAEVARRTPVLSSRTLSERCGGTIALKAENLQSTGSFKVRGALAKLASADGARPGGAVCASAGNHGQGVALAARARGVPCTVFMPSEAALAKVEACESMGATVVQGFDSVDEAIDAARGHAERTRGTFVHPFDDPAVVAGQGTLGLELLEDVGDLACVVVPLGGGGLLSGIAIALKSQRPDVRVIGVQAAACAPYPRSLERGAPVAADSAITIADGIAVKRPGGLTLGLIESHVDDVVVVAEEQIAEAMVLLLERAKLVVEGAGAVGVAALLAGRARPAPRGRTVALLSGGNVDAGLLATVTRRHETLSGRRLVLLMRVPDRPGALARMLGLVAEQGANVLEVAHMREGIDLHVRETGVELVLETRGRTHAATVVAALDGAGYASQVLN